jgi:hypothetical protein
MVLCGAVPARSRWKRVLAIGTAVSAAAVLGLAGWAVWTFGEIVANYGAKNLCSCVFVAGRERQACLEKDLSGYRALFGARIDHTTKTVDVLAFSVRSGRAVYRDGLGCALE